MMSGENSAQNNKRVGHCKKFKEDAVDAFLKMKYTKNDRLPHESVLMREPVSNNPMTCPLPLWNLFQKHGGFTSKGSKKKVV